MKKILFVSILTILFVTESQTESAAESILDYLDYAGNLGNAGGFQHGTQKDIVLVFGAGKSSLVPLLTGAELESIAVRAIKSGFQIRDKNKIHTGVIETLDAVIPHLMIDEENDVSYYDCFGFDESKHVKLELAASFALRKLLIFAESVKMVFAVSYDSIKNDNGHDFLNLAQYANGLIKDMDKYRDAIALVVTKVPNTYIESNGQQHLEDDSAMIESIADSLQLTRTNFMKNMPEVAADEERQTIKRYISFINILLEKDGKGYTKIGVMRRPNRAGLLSGMPLIQTEKSTILKIINKNLQYVQKADNDFGSIVSDKSRAYIDEIAEVLRSKLLADFIRISVDMRTFILQKEKASSMNLYESIRVASIIKGNLSEVMSAEPHRFKKQLIKAIDTLGISLPVRYIKSFFKYTFYLEFIESFSNINSTIPERVFKEIDDQIAYLTDSQLWYTFLIDLHTRLSEYGVQMRANDYDGDEIMELVIKSENVERIVSDLDVKSTLDEVDPQLYQRIQHLHINTFKLKLMQGVWGQSMQPATKNCSADGEQMTVKGYNILISDVIESNCWPQAKHVQIFALNKVFFDADIDRNSMYLSVISPAWEVVLKDGMTSRQIKLIGANGMNYTTLAESKIDMGDWIVVGNNGEALNDRGNGLSGLPGEQGGQFLGIGSSFNENRLEIVVNGGNGALGQDGKNGIDGMDGIDVPEKTDISDLTLLGFKCGNVTTENVGSSYISTYRFCGKPAVHATDGGDGGCGGSGGKSGEVQLFGLKNQSNIVSFQRNGKRGAAGKGGMGGKAARNGRNCNVQRHHQPMTHMGMWSVPNFQAHFNPNSGRVVQCEDAGMTPAGKNGTDGELANCNEIDERNFNFQNPVKSLRQYKHFARMHLAGNVQVSDLTGFLDFLGKNEEINSLFNTMDLIDEFKTIESHNFQTSDSLSFAPYYESLRDQIASHVQTAVFSKEEEKALNYLFTAVMSRLFATKFHSNHIGVVNLFEYMKVVEKRMIKLQQVRRTVYISEYRDEFKSSLDAKIESATKLVKKTVVAKIGHMFSKVGKNIKQMLDETFAMQNAIHDQTEKAKENKQTLKRLFLMRGILNALNMVGSMLSGLGPVGMIAGIAVGFGKHVREKVISSTFKLHTITVPTGLIRENVFQIAEQAKHDFHLFQLQLNDLSTILQNQNMSDFSAIMKSVNLSTIEMQKDTENPGIPGIDRFRYLEETRKDLAALIDDAKGMLNKYGNEKNKYVEHAKESLEIMGKIMKVGEAGLEVYQQIRDNTQKITEVDETIRQLDDQLLVIKQHERNIHNIMIPQFKMVEQTVREAILNSAGKSHCELVVTNWMVQSTLGKIKKLLTAMTQGFSVGKDMEKCFEKINDGITTVMDVYDRIDSYTEKAQLADLMADIAIGSNEIKDRKLRDAVFKMETIINSNLAMEQYKAAMYALKQHKFPLAGQYLGLFGSPSQSSISDVEFTNNAINRISDFVLKISESKSLIENVDQYLYSNYSFINQEAFFKWDHFNYKDEIASLLSGEHTTFVADIRKGLGLNAVKFNEIWIKFKSKNQTIQRQFDEELKKFSVVMQMEGNNFYRCAKRIYYISLENPFKICFSLENGKVIKTNRVYDKLATGDSFLSPYSTWRISLKPKTDDDIGYAKLKYFGRHITEVALEGRGQYLDNKGSIIYDTCNDRLDKYYRLDSISRIRLNDP